MSDKRNDRNLQPLFDKLNEPLPSDEQMDWTAAQVLHRLKSEYVPDPSATADFKNVNAGGSKRRWLAAAVIVILVAASLLLIPVLRKTTGPPPYAIAEVFDGMLYRVAGPETHALGRGERIEIAQPILASGGSAVLALADGSRIEMRAESVLSLDQREDGTSINLNTGGVIVTAATQSRGHLYVRTKDYTVSVSGTVFGVNAEKAGSRVFVIEGEVRVEQGEKLELLRPGQQVATNPLMTVTPMEDALSWSRNVLGHLALLQQATTVISQQDTATSSTIEGSVLRLGSGEPVPGAQVSLIVVPNVAPGGAARPALQTIPSVVTDERGRFLIRNIEPGAYRLAVARNGFVRQEYGQSSDRRPGTVLTIGSNQSLKEIVFRLAPTGAISGRITDSRNEPLANINVQLLRAAYNVNGKKTFVPAIPSVRTNDLGEYRFFWISPGRYVVRADVSRPSLEMALRSPASGIILSDEAQGRIGGEFNGNEVVQQGYTATYYPSVIRASEAVAIDLRSAEQVTGINVRLAAQQLFRVRGRMIDITTGQPSRRASATLTSLDRPADVFHTSSYDAETGAFEVRDVPPGPYELSVAMLPPDPTTMKSRLFRTRLEVGNGDVENLLLRAGPLVPLQGKVLLESPGGLPLSSLDGFQRITVTLWGLTATMNPISRAVSPDGTFTADVSAGEYRLAMMNLPSNGYVKSARLDTTDVLLQPLTVVLTSPESFEIVISATAGQVTGTLHDRNGSPVGIATVVLVPEDRARRDLFKTGSTDLQGQFTFQGITPGNYKLFAWEDIEPFSYFDPEVLQGYEPQGQAIQIPESGRLTTTLRIIPGSR